MPVEEMPHNTLDLTGIESLNDLPVFDVGCDSSAAWNTRFKHLSESMDPEELLKRCGDALPRVQRWQDAHLVITGGEPLLPKYQKFWAELFAHRNFGFSDVTFETNGTQVLGKELRDAINQEFPIKVTFSVSPKLSISGETFENAIVPDAIQSYLDLDHEGSNNTYLKFVVRDEHCIPEIDHVLEQYDTYYGDVYLMPEGATDRGVSITEPKVAELALKHGFLFSTRLHIALFGNRYGT